MIFHIFSIPFLPWVFRRRLFKVLRKKNEIHCSNSGTGGIATRRTSLPAWPWVPRPRVGVGRLAT